uniref:Uncharacterized protein n=1 Tax=Romanomermis culicivorax TaxID=13658 RepID=A0A915L6M5_ROMCU
MRVEVEDSSIYVQCLCNTYLTAVIPLNENSRSLDNRNLQALIKILRAINDNNPDVPTILTDYILNVLCPSTTSSIVC